MEIEITNPDKDSYDFLGWATSANGAVVYPAEDGKSTVRYTVHADRDAGGNALNRNRLYAAWHIKGVERIIMTVDNNNSIYGGAGITMTAKTEQIYTGDDTIKVNYDWYRIADGMYDACFESGLVYIENEKVTGYKFGGTYYQKDGTTPTDGNAEPLGTPFEYKRFDLNSEAAGNSRKMFSQVKNPDEVSTLNIRDVSDCGAYVCVVRVTASNGTRATGYGEIEIAMNKAVYGNVVLKNKTVTYNTKSQAGVIALELGSAADGAKISVEDGASYLMMPDNDLNSDGTPIADTGSRLMVTYKYYVADGNARREITDLSEIKGVNTYYVVVSFAFTPDGDKGNYEIIEPIEAELVITKYEISNIGFTFVHGEDKTAETFSGAYDGVAYGVEATINDRIGTSTTTVAETDDVKLKITVNEVTENGDKVIASEELPTVKAGTYSVVITGVEGEDAGNYALKSGLVLRQEYTIGKSTYDVAGHIKFADKTVEFDNELHEISYELDAGYELPATVKAVYTVEYESEDAGFTAEKHELDNFNDKGNAGRYAGVYTVTVRFEDTAAANYAELESMTATLTITKANLFKYFEKAYGEDLLDDAGFVSGSFAYDDANSYLPTVKSGSRLSNTSNFAIEYAYYLVKESDGTKTELTEGERIKNPGKYEIVASISYVSELYSNNFEEVLEGESTITYVIRDIKVVSVSVEFTQEFEKSGRVVKLGAGFDYGWIKQINVEYEDTGTGEAEQVSRIMHITDETSIALAVITLESNRSTFWHVGEFEVQIAVYEKNSQPYALKVRQEIESVVLKYSVDGGAYSVVPSSGLELLTGRQYAFVAEYGCIDETGATTTASSEASIAAEGLKLGKNVLTLTEENYTFGEAAVSMYEVLGEVSWEYSLNGKNWSAVPESNELVYAGKAYQLRAVSGGMYFAAHTQSGLEAQNVNGYVMEVGRSGDYRIDSTYAFRIIPKVLGFKWDTDSFEYDMFKHVPAIVESGVEEVDKDLVKFSFNYYDANKNSIVSSESIKTVGTYYVSVALGGDVTARGNYTLEGAENAEYYEFAIVKATIEAEVYYSEHTYGRNTTYAKNGELRLSAMKADFGENSAVAGKFQFVKLADGEYEEISGKDYAEELKNTGTLTVTYRYVPENRNYNELIGTVTLEVKESKPRTSDGALSVEFGRDAIRFYLVDQTLDTHGIEVYQLYDSTYQENGVWYGARTPVTNPMFRLLGYGGSIENYKITSSDLSGGKITLIARDGGNSGTIDIPVIDKTPTGIEISNAEDYRKVYYVGETPDFSDITFKVLFGEDTSPVDGLTVGTITHDYKGGAIADSEGTFDVTFSYFSTVQITVTFTKAPKEDLKIVMPSNNVLTYTGEDIPVPEIKFNVGTLVGQNELDGVEVKVVIRNDKGVIVSYIQAEGKYEIVYSFTVTNPRYNTPENVNFTVEVTTNPYKVEITVPETVETAYTGSAIEVPKPTVGQVTDSTNGDAVVPETSVLKVYTITDVKNNTTVEVGYGEVWTVSHAGRYVITVTVKVSRSGEEPYTARTETYEFVVTQAKNNPDNAQISGPEFVLKGADGEIDLGKFTLTADFGADTVVWEYSTSRDGGYTTDKPTAIGTYYVRAKIAATDDYEGLVTFGKKFEVRGESIDSGENGSVTGGNGIGEGWTLDIKRMDGNAVSEVSISKQDVLDGYEVVLKNALGTAVTGQGEYTVRVKLSEELSGRSDLKVFFKDADGNTVEKSASVKDGYIEFKTSEFGTFIITSAVAGEPVGLLVAVIVLGVIAAGMIAACAVVFAKKRKGARK